MVKTKATKGKRLQPGSVLDKYDIDTINDVTFVAPTQLFNFYKNSANIKKILDMCKILIDLNLL